MSKPARETFRIDLQAQPSDCPAAIRLRRLLKTALRRDGLKCLRVEQLPAAQQYALHECLYQAVGGLGDRYRDAVGGRG